MFVRFECGCVGIIIGGDMDSVEAVYIERCTREDPDELVFSLKNCPKGWTPLDGEETLDFIHRIATLIQDGYSHRNLKKAFKSFLNY